MVGMWRGAMMTSWNGEVGNNDGRESGEFGGSLTLSFHLNGFMKDISGCSWDWRNGKLSMDVLRCGCGSQRTGRRMARTRMYGGEVHDIKVPPSPPPSLPTCMCTLNLACSSHRAQYAESRPLPVPQGPPAISKNYKCTIRTERLSGLMRKYSSPP